MSFSNSWAVTNNPADHSKFKNIPAAVRKIRTDLVDRFTNMVYGFDASETAEGIKKLLMREQSSDPAALADALVLYTKEADSYADLYGRHENTGVLRLTRLGYLHLVNARLANDTYLKGINNAGNGTVNLIKATTGDVAMLPDGSTLATSAAPSADAEIANKKYVDDNAGAAAASAAEVKTGTEAAKYVAPSTLVSHEGVAKGWVCFDGTAGTITAADSYNVSGLVDNGSGNYTVTWDTDFGNANYAVFATSSGDGMTISSKAVGSTTVISHNQAGSADDTAIVCVMAIGDR